MKQVAIVVLAACAGTSNMKSSTACLPIAPMRLVVLEHGTEWEPQAELRADGTVIREHHVIARITGDRVVDARGKTLMTCDAQRRVVADDGRALAHFDASDRLIDADGSQLFVETDGSVHWLRDGSDAFKNAKVEGGFAGARRTAAALVLATLTANFGQ